jgi:hypothetical protein
MTAPKKKPTHPNILEASRRGKMTQIRKIMEENPELSLTEASSLFMKRLHEAQAKKRELLKDFAPEKAREPIDKMLETREKKQNLNKKRLLADMDILDREEIKRRARKGLPPLKDQVIIPLTPQGSIPYSQVLNNIQDMKKPAHIKEAFIETFNALQESGNEPYSLTAWAKLNPSQFYLLISKLIPQQAADEKNLPLQVKSITFE